MDPIAAGYCRMESLHDGTLDLIDFCLMNDKLRAKSENEIRMQAAMEKARG